MEEKIFEYIDALAEKLGVAAEFVFAEMLRQKVLDGIFTLAAFGFWLGILMAAFYIGVRLIKKDELTVSEGFEDFHVGALMLVVSSVIGVWWCCMAGIYGTNAVLKLLNPEYYALKELLEVIGK